MVGKLTRIKFAIPIDDDVVTIIYAEDFTRIFRGNLNDLRFTLITCWKEVMK